MRQPFVVGGLAVKPGERRLVDLPISKLSNHAPVTLPVHVLHGAQPGPTMFVSAAIHGDELNGVEIIRRLLRTLDPQSISGTLLCVPVVNVFGFISRSRYLPDRRDLNRSFPGSANGSLGRAARAPLPHRDRQALADRHRPAHRRHPPHQPAADPLRVPQAPARAGARPRLRRRRHAGKPRAARLAARGRARSRRRRAQLRGRRRAALRRVRHPRGRRRHHRRDAEDGHARAWRRRRSVRRASGARRC